MAGRPEGHVRSDAMTPAPGADAHHRLTHSTTAMIRSVDALTGEQLRGPSLLPGWSRAHLIAHLALNGEGLAGVLDGLTHDQSVPMYRSDEARDTDIEDLAAADPAELRDRLMAAGTAFSEAVLEMPEDLWVQVVLRTPGGPSFPASAVPSMRHREVEIHHVDLDVGYGPADWPARFVEDLLDAVSVHRLDDGPFTVRAVDLDREWAVGSGGGTFVSGPGADLGWWLTGRGDAGGLSVAGGPLPRLGAWRMGRPGPEGSSPEDSSTEDQTR